MEVEKKKKKKKKKKKIKKKKKKKNVLRYCEGYCRMVFYMRGIPQCAEYLTAFDDLIDRCLAALLHDPDGALPELFFFFFFSLLYLV